MNPLYVNALFVASGSGSSAYGKPETAPVSHRPSPPQTSPQSGLCSNCLRSGFLTKNESTLFTPSGCLNDGVHLIARSPTGGRATKQSRGEPRTIRLYRDALEDPQRAARSSVRRTEQPFGDGRSGLDPVSNADFPGPFGPRLTAPSPMLGLPQIGYSPERIDSASRRLPRWKADAQDAPTDSDQYYPGVAACP